jgi:type I restriction enzyme S subunit
MTAPKHWEIFPLNALVEVLDNLRVPVNSSERSKRPGSVPYYGATGQVGTIDKAIFDEELLVLGEDGVQFFDPNKPKAYKIFGPAWVNNHAHVLRPKTDRVLQNFLLHFLNQFNYVGYANGTTRLKLTQGAMNSIPVPLPSLAEQHKIVELLEDHLSRLDAALTDVTQAKIKAAQFRKSLLQAAFTGNLDSDGTSYLTEIPSDWSWVTLDEAMSECKNGLTYRNNPELAGFPVSRIETISKGEIDFQKVGYGGLTLEGNQKHLLIPGDILFSHINSMLHVGKVALYKSEMPMLLHGMNLLRITPSDDFVPEFLFHLFQSNDVRKQIWSKAKHAVNQASINIGELKTVVVPKPPIKEQQKIVEILEDQLSRLEASVSLVDVIEKQAAALRRSLLQGAFTGQLIKEVVSV